MQNPIGSQTYLARWRTRTRAWRECLAQALTEMPLTPEAVLRRRSWLYRTRRRIAARKEWLRASMEHADAVEKIVAEAIQRSQAPKPGSAP